MPLNLKAISMGLFGVLAAASAQNLVFTANFGTGVSTGANTATFSGSGSFTDNPCATLITPPSCTLPIFVGSFSASGAINYTSPQILLSFTTTRPSSGTIQFNQGTFNNTNGSAVPLSQYGAGNGQIACSGCLSGGTFLPISPSTISVTCASGGTLNQPCPGNFTALFTISANAVPSTPTTPIPSTLILVVIGAILTAWIFRKKLIWA